MVQRVFPSELDKQALSKISKIGNEDLESFDFSSAIVIKPWGREYLSYKGNHTDIWTLYLKKDAATSMHCHPQKRTSLVILKGEVISSTLDKEYVLNKGGIIIFEKGVFHSTKAVSPKGALMIELESPPKKTDLVRLNDKYGRENKGYEPANEMCFDLSKYERMFLSGNDKSRRLGDMCITINKFDQERELIDYISYNKNLKNILIEGIIFDNNEKEIYGPGELIEDKEIEKIKLKDEIKVLTIQQNILDDD